MTRRAADHDEEVALHAHDGGDEEVAFHAHYGGDEEVAFHAHYGGDEEVAVHVRHSGRADAPPERTAANDLDEVTTAPLNRAARADREIEQFVSMLDIEHASREMDISRTPTTSRRFG